MTLLALSDVLWCLTPLFGFARWDVVMYRPGASYSG